ncbi:hypothetical protein SAMN05660413_01904 [Salegentibacter flavus]|uniref:UbiA prenyltransferase family protein n=1 Tax=Salegentibacter flavus TaxID=287099 RepID=A0A1I5AHZ1_9FLAO|nr:hypothetical protein SAMN05660413_01904 [Salegentibacter flavus]
MALAVVALSLLSYLEYGLNPDSLLLIFIFFGSITGYNFVKYAGLAKLYHRSLARNLRFIQVFSFLVFLGLVYMAFLQTWEVLLMSALLGVFTLLYAAPVLTQNRNLRDLAGIKILIIALVWAGVSVILPLLDHPEVSLLDKILMFFQRALFIIVITLPFEIRDLEFDSEHLATIPQKIGIKKTRLLGWLMLVVILVLEILKEEFNPVNFSALAGVALLSAYALKLADRKQSAYFAAFWVEAVPIAWLILWFSLKMIFA